MMYALSLIVVAVVAGATGAFLVYRFHAPKMEESLKENLMVHVRARTDDAGAYLRDKLAEARLEDQDERLHFKTEVLQLVSAKLTQLHRDLNARVDLLFSEAEPRTLETLKAQFKEAVDKAVSEMDQGGDFGKRFTQSFHW